MAEDNIDDILVRLDEIEKLQTELRHLVPRTASNSSRLARHQDLSRDSFSSIRFPSLFTFPVVSNYTTSSPRNERVQKSTGQLNFSKKLSSNYRPTTVNLENAGKLSKGRSSVKELNLFRDILKSTNSVTKSHGRNSSSSNDSTVAESSKKSTPMSYLTRGITTSRVVKDLKQVIKKGLENETPGTTTGDKTRYVNDEKSNISLFKNEDNTNSIRSSVQTSDSQAYVEKTANSQGMQSCLRRSGCRDNNIFRALKRTFIERIMKKLNYCFVDDERMTVPHHHPGSRAPRRIHVSPASTFKGPRILQARIPENSKGFF